MAGVTVVGTPVPRAEGSDTVAGIGDFANNSAPAAVANAVADAAGVRLFGLPITAEPHAGCGGGDSKPPGRRAVWQTTPITIFRSSNYLRVHKI
ncbi:MAG: hypothetical protein Q8S00_19265 [Deltaproteobacteria bacterium]|nr:hypothetical protein [Deltaproteobacteria bacterium]MDZ4340961.1 hypothetical protein [Candidatus Binatia bacterium]